MDPCPFSYRDLCGEVRGAAESVNSESTSRGQRGATQCAKADDAGAEQRRRHDVVETIGEVIDEILVHDDERGVSTIHVPAGKGGLQAEILVVGETEATTTAGACQPRGTHAFAPVKERGT